jgi:hypothetical protein
MFFCGLAVAASGTQESSFRVEAVHCFLTSHVKLNLAGLDSSVPGQPGKRQTPPEWSVQTRDGREVASGKFQYG